MTGVRHSESIERLGLRGTVRVLDDLLDKNRLTRLANAVGVSYPGLRNRSQKRQVLLTDLAQKALTEKEACAAVLKSLDKLVLADRRRWKGLSDTTRTSKLDQLTPETGGRDFGIHLYLLAGEENGTNGILARWLEGSLSPRDEDDAQWREKLEKHRKEADRERRRRQELERKLERTDSQLKRVREHEKDFKRKLGEVETALAAEEKRRRALETALEKSGGQGVSVEGVDRLGRTVRQLVNQQRKWVHELERLSATTTLEQDAERGALLTETAGLLTKERNAVRRERKQYDKDENDRLEGMRRELLALRRKVKAPEPLPRTDELPRVGVFIDVQNVYYGARQLKGKLDFEALMQAAGLDRRVANSTAYVVESKERDQTAFLNLLGKLDIDVRKKSLRIRADGSKKGDWDMEIALDMLDAGPKLDVAVLVSGDGDFTSLLHRLRSGGTRVEVIGFPRTTSKSLIAAADRYTPLDRKFMIRTKS